MEHQLKEKSHLLIFNFLLCGFFVSSIISISIFTFFQVLLILFSIFEFLFNTDKANNKKNIINFDIKIVGYSLIILGFIISLIYTTTIKSSISRLPIYLIVILLVPSLYFLFSKFKENIKNIDKSYLILNICITLFVIFLNFFIILKANGNFKLLLKTRQVGFLRNAIGFSYCMIFPIFYLIYNQYLFNKIKKTKLNFLFLPLIIFAIIIQVFLLITSGSRTALFSMLFSIFLSFMIYLFVLKKKTILVLTSILFSLIIIIVILYLFLPLIKNNKIEMFYKNINKYLIKNKLYTFYRFNKSTKSISNLYYYFKNPSEISNYNTSESFRVAAIISSIKIIQKRFLVGTGPFSWYYYIKQNKDLLEIFNIKSFKHTHCHNDLLQIFSEFGLIFFSGFILILISSFKNIYSLIKERKFESVILFSVLMIFLIGGLTDYLFGHPLIGPYYGFFIGIFLSIENSNFKKVLNEKVN